MSDHGFGRVGLLLGGLSAERPVSLKSGAAMAAALGRKGYDPLVIDVGRDLPARLVAEGVDTVVIALHGPCGEDGTIQGMLEFMGIPYTGSGVAASSLCMDKVASKIRFLGAGLPTPAWLEVDGRRELAHLADEVEGAMPGKAFFIKPKDSGSSVGIARALGRASLLAALAEAARHSRFVMVEEEVKGVEVTLTVLNGAPLPLIEIQPVSGFYDYHNKYTAGCTRYLTPPPSLTEAQVKRAQEVGLAAYRAAGCKGLARVDLIVDGAGEAWLLEINTIPGMTELSLAPQAARAAGIGFDELVEQILRGAGLEVTCGGGS